MTAEREDAAPDGRLPALGCGTVRGGGRSRAARRTRRLLWLATAAALLAAVAVGWSLLPLGEWLAGLRGWIVELGVAGVGLFAAIYVVAVVLLAPASLLTIAAGFAYGLWAVPVVMVSATIGAAAAFLIARHLARHTVRRVVESRREIAAIDRAVAAEGWKIVLLLRLSPVVPFGLQSYVLGVTAVPFLHFAAATFVGIIPATALYVYVGALGDMEGEAGALTWVFFGAGLLATAALVVLIARKAAAHLRQAGLGGSGA